MAIFKKLGAVLTTCAVGVGAMAEEVSTGEFALPDLGIDSDGMISCMGLEVAKVVGALLLIKCGLWLAPYAFGFMCRLFKRSN